MKKLIAWFETVNKHDIGLVGGKGANLGEMLQAGFPIPYGFVVTSNAYFYFIKHNNLDQKIKNLLAIVNFNNARELTDISIAIKKLIFDGEIPADLIKEINHHYENIMARENKIVHKKTGSQLLTRVRSMYNSPLVAVRSSATAEDLPGASFAGQQETFLNVRGEHDLIMKVKECWASLFNERAIYYRHEQGFDHFRVGLAAVIQRMAQSEMSGISFSIDPVTNNKKVITIEAIFGLGEYIVQGIVSPDHYEIDKNELKILVKQPAYQTVKLVKKGHDNVEVKMPKKIGMAQKISDEMIVKLAAIVKNIEKHYYFPQDIEWAIENNNIFIVQSRPITTVKEDNRLSKLHLSSENEIILKGDPASPGIGIGRPVVIKSPKEIDLIQKGDILVAPQTNPDYVPAMKRAAGIVTERGGRTSHAAIVSRELGIPAIVGAENATKILHKEKIISVNGELGEVYRGSVGVKQVDDKIIKMHADAKKIETKTKIYVNLAEPEQALKMSREHVDGIGLLRAEFMIAAIGTHPKQIIKEHKQHEYINKLADSIEKFIAPFSPRPVVYRATDFKTNEYKYLKGGKEYEPHEENPMIGYRGASRYIIDKEVFQMELAAIKKLRDKGYRNLWLMIPFIRTPAELVQIRNILEEYGLLGLPSFKLWIMVEVPSTVILLEEFIKIGIDGVSVGTNDLTMLILGVDRDNQEIAHLYNERNPAVLWALEKIVKTTKAHGISCSVCGQAPSDYPEIVEKLVQWGVTSMSVNPDVIDKTRILVSQLEEKLWQK